MINCTRFCHFCQTKPTVKTTKAEMNHTNISQCYRENLYISIPHSYDIKYKPQEEWEIGPEWTQRLYQLYIPFNQNLICRINYAEDSVKKNQPSPK